MKTKDNHELSVEQQSFVRKVMSDPVRFANHILGINLLECEAEIL
jgi:hypothetical protein